MSCDNEPFFKLHASKMTMEFCAQLRLMLRLRSVCMSSDETLCLLNLADLNPDLIACNAKKSHTRNGLLGATSEHGEEGLKD